MRFEREHEGVTYVMEDVDPAAWAQAHDNQLVSSVTSILKQLNLGDLATDVEKDMPDYYITASIDEQTIAFLEVFKGDDELDIYIKKEYVSPEDTIIPNCFVSMLVEAGMPNDYEVNVYSFETEDEDEDFSE